MKENIDNDEKMMPFCVHDNHWSYSGELSNYALSSSHKLWRLLPPHFIFGNSHPVCYVMLYFRYSLLVYIPSVLWRCWLGSRKGIRPVKTEWWGAGLVVCQDPEPFFRTTQVSQYQKGKTNLDFTEARDSEWQWHQLGHVQVCTSLQTDNHASTPQLSFLQAGCPSCHPTNSVKALKALDH